MLVIYTIRLNRVLFSYVRQENIEKVLRIYTLIEVIIEFMLKGGYGYIHDEIP